jgi:hypothetical protein
VEERDGAFPPPPLERSIPLPLYGAIHRDLEWWKQRRFNVVTWSALDMLFSERQLKHYRWARGRPRGQGQGQGRRLQGARPWPARLLGGGHCSWLGQRRHGRPQVQGACGPA